ncbi:MAG TPA: transporter substrate-binding domain-containing protein [Candidatus Limnocylindrales bacterium]|nr:transporter substrate-binding domain-containing protein [Candidatus Limnocylindrales bacterium]
MRSTPTDSKALRRDRLLGAVVFVVLGAIVAACSGGPAASAVPTGADPATDKLAQVQARGTLVLWTDPDYAPQSFAVEGATRLASTKCAPNQLTAPEISGYDAETGKLVAAALGVEPCFVVTPFDAMIAGSWGDRWDVAWGSGAITTGRMEKLYVTQPYYSTPANFFVKPDSPFQAPEDLSGREIGVCSGCTHQSYLERTLELPGVTLDYVVEDPTIVTYNSEPPGLDDTAAGKIDAFLCSEPVGLGVMAEGVQLRELETAAYYTYKTGYADRDVKLAMGPFLAAVNAAVADLHATGRLKALSLEFFEKDYATSAAAFDLAALDAQNAPGD